jgi:pheromone a factor receptor
MPGSNKSLNHNRYMRLIALSSTQLLVNLPMSLYDLIINSYDVSPWISWENAHLNYSFVGQLHSAAWRLHANFQLEMNRWIIVFSALSFFAFFGFAEEARKNYFLVFSFARSRLHLSNFGTRSTRSSLRSPNTSFGPGIKKGTATLLSFKNGFSRLGSRRGPVSATQSKASSSEYRLTSDDSVFEGVDAQLKALGVVPDNLTHQTTVITLPTASHLPFPPPPAPGLSIPPNRLDSPLPHRPVSSSLDLSEKV